MEAQREVVKQRSVQIAFGKISAIMRETYILRAASLKGSNR